jgi:hypothetical protein
MGERGCCCLADASESNFAPPRDGGCQRWFGRGTTQTRHGHHTDTARVRSWGVGALVVTVGALVVKVGALVATVGALVVTVGALVVKVLMRWSELWFAGGDDCAGTARGS